METAIIFALITLYIFIGCVCMAYWEEEAGSHFGSEPIAFLALIWPLSLIVYLGFKLGYWLFHGK